MTTNYKEYNDARTAIVNCIENKQTEITTLETEMLELRRVKRMLDEEFKNKIDEKEKYIG